MPKRTPHKKRHTPPAGWVWGPDYEREHGLSPWAVGRARITLAWSKNQCCDGPNPNGCGGPSTGYYYPRSLLDETFFPPSVVDAQDWIDPTDAIAKLPKPAAAKFVGCSQATLRNAEHKGHVYLGRNSDGTAVKLRATRRRLKSAKHIFSQVHYEVPQLRQLRNGFAETKKLRPTSGKKVRRIRRHGKDYVTGPLLQKNTGLYDVQIARLVESGALRQFKTLVDGVERTFYCLDDARDYIEQQAIPEGYARPKDVFREFPHLTHAKLIHYKEHLHPILKANLQSVSVALDHAKRDMRVWNLEQCKQIEVWETAHENDVIDAEGRTYCDLAGVYRDQSMLEWYDMAAAGRLSGKGQGVRKHQKAPHARLGRCLCTRDARRQIKETSGRTRWQPFTLVLATDVAVLKAERDCWRLGVFFDAATNIIRLTDGTAHKTLKLTIHALTEKRWVGDAEGAEERTVDGRTLWTYPLPAGVVLPEGLEIPTLPAIPDKPLPLPGEEAAQPDPADEATVEPRPSYGVPDRNATWLYWRKTEKLRPAEIRDRWNELHPKAAIAAGKNGSKLVKVSIGRAEDLEKQGISCQLVPPLKP